MEYRATCGDGQIVAERASTINRCTNHRKRFTGITGSMQRRRARV